LSVNNFAFGITSTTKTEMQSDLSVKRERLWQMRSIACRCRRHPVSLQ